MELYFADISKKTAEDIIKNGIALHRDYGMNVLDIVDGMPTLWSHTLNVPGRNEIVDFTDILNDGKPAFKDRKISISLEEEEKEQWYKKIIHFAQRVHGKKFNIMRSDDEYHYCTGRIILDAKRLNALYNQYTLNITCNPYRTIVPNFAQMFTDFVPTKSYLYDIYIGEYCETIEASYELTSGSTSGYIHIYKEGESSYSQSVTIKDKSISFTPKVSGRAKISFVNVKKISLSGNNLEV